MKIAIVTDQHFGGRNDSPHLLYWQERFYSEIFFPELSRRNIKTVLDLGDTFDRRKYINFLSLQRCRNFYFDKLQKLGIELHSIVGNHTTFHKNTNEVNSCKLLIDCYNNATIYENLPEEVEFDGTKILLSPWICKDNYEASMKAFFNSEAKVLMGHFEIQGFEMERGFFCDEGMDRSVLSRFDAVYSGHFHQPSSQDNITYLGCPYQLNWNDYGESRGFHIFDTETLTMERIENPLKMFYKVRFDPSTTLEDLENFDFSIYKNTFIRLIVSEVKDSLVYNELTRRLLSSECAELRILETNKPINNLTSVMSNGSDTMSILTEYVDTINIKEDKSEIKRALQLVYSRVDED